MSREPSDPKPGVPGEELAKWSLHAPLLCIIANVAVHSLRIPAGLARQVVGGICAFLLATGLLAAVAALVRMERDHRRPVLARALVGLTIGAFVLAGTAYFYLVLGAR